MKTSIPKSVITSKELFSLRSESLATKQNNIDIERQENICGIEKQISNKIWEYRLTEPNLELPSQCKDSVDEWS